MNIVIYHDNCLDGFTAAYAAFSFLGNKAEYIPANYGQEPPDITAKDNVYIVDFSYPRETILELKSRCNKLVVLDHHKKAKEQLLNIPGTIFDMNKSGAVLAWEYWNKNKELPALFRYAQDYDLWKKELSYSKEVSAFLFSLNHSFDTWEILSKLTDQELIEMAKPLGSKSLEHRALKINQQVEKTLSRKAFQGYIIGVIQADSEYRSEACQIVYDNYDVDFAVNMSYNKKEDRYHYSCRSSKESKVDVDLFARQYGGGGHKNAAGFSSDKNIFL